MYPIVLNTLHFSDLCLEGCCTYLCYLKRGFLIIMVFPLCDLVDKYVHTYTLYITTSVIAYLYMTNVSLLGWLYRWTSIGKGVRLCRYNWHVYLDRIVPRWLLYVHEYECTIKLWKWKYTLWCRVYDMMNYEYV